MNINSDQSGALYSGLLSMMWLALHIEARTLVYKIPDEQRLYRDLLSGYESSVRPVLNASKTVVIDFRLSLNQIVDLDERTQVLTTNVFIDQEWQDDKLKWHSEDYNGIKTLRVPAHMVWLPDTFIFNNADDGATGFMQGVYVVLNKNGSVLWPVPVKLKSSCKVDITYFPFDEQKCVLRFGSWIYSGEWMDFESSLDSVDLENYIDNSEWELVAIQYEKGIRKYACCPNPHPDLTYILHMRRRTFYYIFNIIVPCIMLSILTLLTFWLPTTSGEKISLGLSVFLAFSMFMLLIAEEVPATSESVPLIGVYLTTVMTMTSVSVIMSVMVINLYNRGYRAQAPPGWLKTIVLNWLCKLLRMKHDIEQLALTIRLEEQEEERYTCELHGVYPRRRSMFRSPRRSIFGSLLPSPSTSPQDRPSPDQKTTPNPSHRLYDKEHRGSLHPYANSANHFPEFKQSNCDHQETAQRCSAEQPPLHSDRSVQYEGFHSEGPFSKPHELEEEEPVWKRRDTLDKDQREAILKKRNDSSMARTLIGESKSNGKSSRQKSKTSQNGYTVDHGMHGTADSCVSDNHIHAELDTVPIINTDDGLGTFDSSGKRKKGADTHCNRKKALRSRREIVVEWQTMAMVIDRLLFWIFLIATVVAYVVILLIIPYANKPENPDSTLPIRILKRT